MRIPLYNQSWEKVGERELPADVFGVAPKSAVLHEAVVAQRANARKPIAHTKTRGEVRGGGKKPWRQKGTGRARHGSIRSPIWIGGGITFGPRSDRSFGVKINRKTKRLALRMSLSDKVADGKLLLVEDLKIPERSTKAMAAFLMGMPVASEKTLLLLPSRDASVAQSARNIPGVTTRNAESVSVTDILGAGALVTTIGGVEKLEQLFGKKERKVAA